jgi:dUTP pyrophosphatase
MDIELKVLDERLHGWGLPDWQSDMAAGLDLRACLQAPLTLEPGATGLVPSGIALNMGRRDIAAVIWPRSGLGHKRGLVLGNLTGLIDPDYTAEILISVWNRTAPGGEAVTIAPGDRIAQLVFLPVLHPRLTLVPEFSTTTARGGGGFGSTGVKA